MSFGTTTRCSESIVLSTQKVKKLSTGEKMILVSHMKTIPELFRTILNGDKEVSRTAARAVRKTTYSANGGKYEDIKAIINGASEKYRIIIEEFRQENFVMAVSVMYFLHDREQDPDFIFPWLFHLLKHKNGNIRHCAVKMFWHELGPLTVHIRVQNWQSKSNRLSPKQLDKVLFDLYTGLEIMASEYFVPAYKKYKYVDSLPSGTYKSIQMVLARMEEYCGEAILKNFRMYYTDIGIS